jgi:hypothetical protein
MPILKNGRKKILCNFTSESIELGILLAILGDFWILISRFPQ